MTAATTAEHNITPTVIAAIEVTGTGPAPSPGRAGRHEPSFPNGVGDAPFGRNDAKITRMILGGRRLAAVAALTVGAMATTAGCAAEPAHAARTTRSASNTDVRAFVAALQAAPPLALADIAPVRTDADMMQDMDPVPVVGEVTAAKLSVNADKGFTDIAKPFNNETFWVVTADVTLQMSHSPCGARRATLKLLVDDGFDSSVTSGGTIATRQATAHPIFETTGQTRRRDARHARRQLCPHRPRWRPGEPLLPSATRDGYRTRRTGGVRLRCARATRRRSQRPNRHCGAQGSSEIATSGSRYQAQALSDAPADPQPRWCKPNR